MKKMIHIFAALITVFCATMFTSCEDVFKEVAQNNVWVEKDFEYTIGQVPVNVHCHLMYNDGGYTNEKALKDGITIGEGWNILFVFETSDSTVGSIYNNKYVFKNLNGTVDWSKEDPEETMEKQEDETKMKNINFGFPLWSVTYIANFRAFEKTATKNVPDYILKNRNLDYTELTDMKDFSLKKILASLLLNYLD